jgi:hypothetical protein
VDQAPHSAVHGGARQYRSGLCLNRRRRISCRVVRPISQVDHNVDTVEVSQPVGLGADIADRAKFDARNRFCLAARYSENGVASLDEDAAERTADEPGCTGHQNARQTAPLLPNLRLAFASDLRVNALKRWQRRGKAAKRRPAPS